MSRQWLLCRNMEVQVLKLFWDKVVGVRDPGLGFSMWSG